MRLFGTIYGALIGLMPGVVVLTLADGDSALTLVGSLLVFAGALVGTTLSFRRGRWLVMQGLIGATIGLLIGLGGFLLGWDTDVVLYVIMGAFLMGLLAGQAIGGRP